MTLKSCSKTLLNQQGYTVPLVMVLATVGAIMVLTMSETVLNAAGLSANRGQVEAYQTFVENMKNVMEDPVACTHMLEGLQVVIDPSNVVNGRIVSRTSVDAIDSDYNDPPMSGSQLMAAHDGTTNINIHRNWQEPNGDFGIDRMEIELLGNSIPERSQRLYDPSHYAAAALTPPPVLHAYPARFIFHPSGIRSKVLREMESVDGAYDGQYNATGGNTAANEKVHSFEDGNFGGGSLEMGRIDIRLFLNIELNALGGGIHVIRSCYGYNSAAALCTAAGGTYAYKPTPGDSNPLFADERNIKCKSWRRCFQSPNGLVDHPSQCPAPYNKTDVNGVYINADQVGVMGNEPSKSTTAGASLPGDVNPKYVCNWCHPFPEDDCVDNPATPEDECTNIAGTNMNVDELEAAWKRLMAQISDLMAVAPDPLNAPTQEIQDDLYRAATEWMYLEEATRQAGLSGDTTSQDYQDAAQLRDTIDVVNQQILEQTGTISNLQAEISYLEDALEAPGPSVANITQSDLNTLQSNYDQAVIDYQNDPSGPNQLARDEALEELNTAQMIYDNPQIAADPDAYLAQRQQDLQNAQTLLDQYNTNLQNAQTDFNTWTSSDGRTATDVLGGHTDIRELLLSYGISEEILIYMDPLLPSGAPGV